MHQVHICQLNMRDRQKLQLSRNIQKDSMWGNKWIRILNIAQWSKARTMSIRFAQELTSRTCQRSMICKQIDHYSIDIALRDKTCKCYRREYSAHTFQQHS